MSNRMRRRAVALAAVMLIACVAVATADERELTLVGLADFAPGDVQPIEDPAGHMAAFYGSLAATTAGGTGHVTRICHFGDSLIEMDLLSGPARRILQKRFGDAGHGFVRVSWTKPWYRHQDVEVKLSSKWINHEQWQTKSPSPSNLFGMGGPVSIAFKKGATARYGTVRGEIGSTVSRLEVLALESPDGGRFAVDTAAGKRVFNTRESAVHSASAVVHVTRGPNKFEIEALDANVRLFGVILENDGPGVVYDALGINGIGVAVFSEVDTTEFVRQLQHRSPALLVLGLGSNDASDKALNLGDYRRRVTRAVTLLKENLPQTSILLMGPLDRGIKKGGALVSMPKLQQVVQVQREVAAEQQIAFWSAFDAMGGEGSMGRWYRSSPRLGAGDLMHPTEAGSEALGEMFARALLGGMADFIRERQIPDAPIREADPLPVLEPTGE